MQAEDIIDVFCKVEGIDKPLLMGFNKDCRTRTKRYILYLILREKAGLSSYKIAKIFGRARRNIVRCISMIKHHINVYKDVEEEYNNALKKIEGITEATPSDNMEESN